MPWNSLIGQTRVRSLLHAVWKSRIIPGALLLHGLEGIGKDALAMEFAALVNCLNPSEVGSCGECASCKKIAVMQHPNVKFICALPVGKGEDARKDDPIAKLDAETLGNVREELAAKWSDRYRTIAIPKANEIKMSSIRAIKKDLSMSTGEGRRVVIISRADMMSDESQNALLKTLEEPPENCAFVLTTSSRDRLKQTILSRCQSVRCDTLADDLVTEALIARDGLEPAAAAACAELGAGSFGLARQYAGEEFLAARETAVGFLRTIAMNKFSDLYTQLGELARTRDKAVLEQFLMILLHWYRDAEILRLGGSVPAHFADGSDALRRFVDRYPQVRCDDAVAAIERAASDVRRNANVFLVFRGLSARLREAMRNS